MTANTRPTKKARPASAANARRREPIRSLLAFVLVIVILYVGKPVIIPLALALLLTFILTPLVMTIQRRGLSRVPSVLLVVAMTLGLAGAIGWGVGWQLSKLANDLPAHAGEMRAKIARMTNSGAGPISKLLETFQGIGETEKKTADGTSTPDKTIYVASEKATPLERLGHVVGTVVEPLADAALIAVLVIFMLIRREDLRNRLIGLLGHTHLTGTTRVLVQSAQRISKLLLMQLCVNAGFGAVFGLALLIIGVPYAFLWAFLTCILRFVPYVGTWIAAAFPILLSFATAHGFAQPITVLAVFIVLDLLTANAVEPLLFSHSTGVSAVALLVAAVFWTWVWGPIGLVLSTPLTVCLVVLGQHVPRLRFLSLLLGDQPALAPAVSYYQRLLAGDEQEAMEIAAVHAKTAGSDHLPDDVLIPALRLARRDRVRSGLVAEDEAFIFDTTELVTQKAAGAESVEADKGSTPADAGEALATEPALAPLVIGCAAHHRAEELTLGMLKGMLVRECRVDAVSTRTLPLEVEAMVRRDRPAVVFISVIPPGGISQARYLSRRLRKSFPELNIVVGYFGKVRDFDRLLVRLRSSGASYVATSLSQARGQIVALLPKPAAIKPVPGEANPGLIAATAP